jgi:cell volume regulation protein A
MESLHASDWLLLGGAVLVLAGIGSSLIASRFGAPLLLVFMVLGMLLGEDGPGGVKFDDVGFAYTLGSLALAVILFDGGLRTRIAHVRNALAPAATLATIGVLITSALTAFAAVWLLKFDYAQGLLLGAIIASTDAAAVFFLLRANGLHLQRRVGATLEVESGSNDPFAVFLTVTLTGWIASQGGTSPASMLLSLLLQFGIGSLTGVLGGIALAQALNRLALPAGLHPLLAVAGAVGLFGFTNVLGGSGFLAVYLAGLVVGNRPVRAFANVLSVHDAATWLAQLVMFLVLGLLVTPTKLLPVLLPALGIAAFLMLVARPVAVALCLAPFGFRKRDITFVSWVGLRGAVGIFLASIPLLANLAHAQTYFIVAFVVVLVSLLVQGWTLSFAARWLGAALPRRDPPTRRIELDLPGQIEFEMVGYRVAPECAALRGARLPGWARAALVVRAGQVQTAEQAGALQADDYAYYLAPPGNVYRLDWLFAEPKEAREAEREMFGEFVLPGNVPLGALAEFYDLAIPPRHSERTADELFSDRFDGEPQIGDRLRLGAAMLVVRDLVDEKVARVGLKFDTVSARLFGDSLSLPRARSPLRRLRSRLSALRRPRPKL